MATLADKVYAWLEDNRRAKRHPKTPTALARACHVSQSTVVNWLDKGGQPRAKAVARLCAVMGVPLAWLTDDSKPARPRPDGVEISVFLEGLTDEERKSLQKAMKDPAMRAALIAYGRSHETK